MEAPIQTLTSLAILKADLDDGRRDYLTYIETLVSPILRAWDDSPVSDGLVATRVLSEYGLRIPDRAIQLVLRRLVKRGYLKREQGTYHVVQELPDLDLTRKRQQAEKQIGEVCSALITFAQERHSLSWADNEALNALLSFLAQFGVECLRAFVFRTAIPDPPASAPRHHFIVGDFIRTLYENSDAVFDSVIVLVKGQMYANALTCPDLEGIEKTFKDVTFYLDTPLVLSLLNVQGEEDYRAVYELVTLVQRLKGDVAVFEHTVAELEAVLKGAADNIENPGALGRVVREMRRCGLQRGDILLKLSSFESELRDYGVRIRKTPEYDKAFQISEVELEKAIQDQVSYRNPKALEFDINSVRSIFNLRHGSVPRRLEDSKAVLVTSNHALARAAYELGKNHNSAKEVSVAITDFSLANVAWLKSPMDAPELPEKETLAACYAAIEPDPQLWSKYLSVLDSLQSQGKISIDDHAVLRISGLAERELMEMTLGEESSLTGNSVSGILRRVKEDLTRDHAQAVVQEKVAHEATRRELRSAVERQNRLERRIEMYCSRIVRMLYLIVAALFAVMLFVSMLLASGLTGSFVLGSPIATAFTNTLIVFGILWSVFSALSGKSVLSILERWERESTRKLTAWVKARFVGIKEDAA